MPDALLKIHLALNDAMKVNQEFMVNFNSRISDFSEWLRNVALVDYRMAMFEIFDTEGKSTGEDWFPNQGKYAIWKKRLGMNFIGQRYGMMREEYISSGHISISNFNMTAGPENADYAPAFQAGNSELGIPPRLLMPEGQWWLDMFGEKWNSSIINYVIHGAL